MIALAGISHLTFDCYGTLIDWERGILGALQPWMARSSSTASPEVILRSYIQHEARLELQPWMPYREVLRGAMRAMANDFALPLKPGEEDTLSDSLSSWPPFPDTVAALQRLSTRFKLVILSNTDDSLFRETQKHLQVQFAEIVTAEQVRCYKPGHAHFHEALRRLNVPAERILHIAQSLYHDHGPARQLGFHTAWINRPSLLPGTGLAPDADAKPHLTCPDLASLTAQILC
jgi:2-haloacid dehalogenase